NACTLLSQSPEEAYCCPSLMYVLFTHPERQIPVIIGSSTMNALYFLHENLFIIGSFLTVVHDIFYRQNIKKSLSNRVKKYSGLTRLILFGL
ncbi:MAG: hypothetical protein ACFFFH_17065, partial [Candidatus Thorarchaeota archaeon]